MSDGGAPVGGQQADWQWLLGGGTILAIGGVLATVHLTSIATAAENWDTILTGGVPSLLFSLAVLAIGAWAIRNWEPGALYRLAGWSLGGTASFFVLAFLATVLIESQGGSLPLDQRWFSGASSVGALLGTVLGMYDVRHVRSQQRWREAKARTERLNERLRRSNERLMVLNRVLRHNVRNDLNVVQGRAELIRKRNGGVDERDAATIADVADNLVEQSDKARTLETLMQNHGEHHAIDLVSVLERELASLGRDYPTISVETTMPDEQPIRAAPSLDTAVANVLENAAKHNDADDSLLWITVEKRGDEVELTVADNGPGIPDHELDVLEAGAETKLKHASGLGLWTAVWVLDHSDGDIVFESNDPRGTVVRMTFPAAVEAETIEFETSAGTQGALAD